MRVIFMCQVDYVHYVIRITSNAQRRDRVQEADLLPWCVYKTRSKSASWVYCKVPASRYEIDSFAMGHIMTLTHMKQTAGRRPSRVMDAKSEALRQQGSLHPNPEHVLDESFQREEFFDSRDLVQVRYEMLRRRQIDGAPVTEVASAFGVSRQAYYVTEAAFEARGIAGLMPRRRGPQRAHKCTDEILDFVEQWRADTSPENNVSEAVRKRFGVAIHPRSLIRALTRRKKKQQ
jgi:transposase